MPDRIDRIGSEFSYLPITSTVVLRVPAMVIWFRHRWWAHWTFPCMCVSGLLGGRANAIVVNLKYFWKRTEFLFTGESFRKITPKIMRSGVWNFCICLNATRGFENFSVCIKFQLATKKIAYFLFRRIPELTYLSALNGLYSGRSILQMLSMNARCQSGVQTEIVLPNGSKYPACLSANVQDSQKSLSVTILRGEMNLGMRFSRGNKHVTCFFSVALRLAQNFQWQMQHAIYLISSEFSSRRILSSFLSENFFFDFSFRSGMSISSSLVFSPDSIWELVAGNV